MKKKDIIIRDIISLRGPSIWTYPPALEAWIDIGEFEDYPSNKLPGFSERLKAWLPSLVEHRCNYGEHGGFLRRLDEGTWIGHVLEHVALELMTLGGLPDGFGRTRETTTRGVYKLVVSNWQDDITRTALDEYLWVTGAASVARDAAWIGKHTEPDMHVEVVDVSSAYAVIGVMGPNSRTLLQRASRADFSKDAFPFGTSQLVDVGFTTVRATRLTYIGELGWELYIPAEFASAVFDLLHELGADLGVRNAGYYSINAMRLEKGYRAFGPELNPDYNPVEAGLLFACKLKTDIPFLGRAAVEAAKDSGPRRKLVSFVLTDADVMLWGGELVLRDGAAVGQVVSAAWGTTLNAGVCLAYIWNRDERPVTTDDLNSGSYAINVGGNVTPATLHLKPPFDPAGAKIKQ